LPLDPEGLQTLVKRLIDEAVGVPGACRPFLIPPVPDEAGRQRWPAAASPSMARAM
jgi:hypothetical protein